jgi:VanZ family protein
MSLTQRLGKMGRFEIGSKEKAIRTYPKHKALLFYWLPIFIYCLLIYIQSSYPSLERVPQFPYLDKLTHGGAYGLLSILFYRAYRTHIKNNLNLVILLSIASSSLYGITDELHQHYVPYRNADLMDIVADIIGSILGVYVYRFFADKSKVDKKTNLSVR